MKARRSSCIKRLFLVSLSAALPGCNGSLPTASSLSQVEVPHNFEHATGGTPRSEESASNWWASWHDPALERLVDRVLEANADVRIASARLAEASSVHAIVDSFRHPTIGVGADGGGGAGRASWPKLLLLPNSSETLSEHLEGVSGVLEPDIFGAKADDANAAWQMALSVQEQLDGVRLVATAEAAQNYLEARGLERRLRSLDKGIEALRKLAKYVEARFEGGQAQSYDVATVEERLRAYEGKRPLMLSAIEARRRHAAILAGLPPSADVVPRSGGRINAPKEPSGGLPSEVLERRPDVRARAAAVEAQASRTNGVRKDLLPRFKISFFGGNGRLQFGGIPGFQGTGGLVDLSVQLPIFTAGRIQANIAANEARLLEAAAEYDKAVLQALEEVENAYTRRHNASQRLRSLNEALISSRRNNEIMREMYESGRKTLADVVAAEIDLIEREDEVIQAEVDAALSVLSLFVALGGGW